MAYIPTVWQNNTVTAINADNLNKIEAGIVANETSISNLIIVAGDSNPEIVSARGTEASLSNRLDTSDDKIGILLEKQTGIFSILEYGADPTFPASENTIAIQAAMDAMGVGSTLIIPEGDFSITNLLYVPPNECTLECKGSLIATSATGTALKIGNPATTLWRQRIVSLKVKSMVRDITVDRVGIEIINSYSGKFEITFINGFEKNLLLRGANNIGFSYNEFRLGDLQDAKKSIFMTADSGGWVNENNFYGGRFSFSSAITDYTGCVHLTIDRYDVHPSNNNHFYSPSFETNSLTALACIIEGYSNAIIHCRLECTGQIYWTNAITMTLVSQTNHILYGYGVFSLSSISDLGSYNKIFAHDGMILNANSSVSPGITLRNNYSGTMKAVSIQDSGGVERFNVKGLGTVFSNDTGYFQKGVRWSTSDGLYIDRGLFNGSNSPEGVITAKQGSIYTNNLGGAGTTLYIKETGVGNTGWVAK